MGLQRDKDLPIDVEIHAHCADTCKDLVWLGREFFFFSPKCFAQVLSGEQRKTEKLTIAMLHKILYILYSFSSPNRDIEMETKIQLTKQREKVM